MQTKIKEVKTFWVGMTDYQKELLTSGLVKVIHNDANPMDIISITKPEVEAMSDLRLALLNM